MKTQKDLVKAWVKMELNSSYGMATLKENSDNAERMRRALEIATGFDWQWPIGTEILWSREGQSSPDSNKLIKKLAELNISNKPHYSGKNWSFTQVNFPEVEKLLEEDGKLKHMLDTILL